MDFRTIAILLCKRSVREGRKTEDPYASGASPTTPIPRCASRLWSRLWSIPLGVRRVAVVVSMLCLAVACSTTGGSSGAGGGRRPWRPRRRRRRGPVVTAKVAQKDVPVDIAAIGNVEAFATISRALAGHRHAHDVLVPRRRLRQAGTAAVHARSAPVRGGARAGRGQPDARPGAARAGRSAARARRGERRVSAAHAERQAQLIQRGIISKDQRRAGARRRPTRPPPRSRPTGRRSRARGRSSSRSRRRSTTRESAARLHHDQVADRRPAPATSREGRQPRHRQPDRADDDRAGRSRCYVTFSVPAVHLPTIKQHMAAGKLPVTATPQDADGAAGDRRARRSSTTPST